MNKIKFVVLVVTITILACSSQTGVKSTVTPAIASPFPTPELANTVIPNAAIPTRTPPPCLIVTAEKALNLRYEPSPDTAILAWLYNGEQIIGLAYGGGWWEIITQDGRHGFVKADYVTHCP